ncbi:response regulator [Nocardioides lentus]|uniref:Response regulator n=1 Tax=Nocardioides lentus TaxID=338077 RepID=A0ABN2P9X1_9ACTN
MTVFALVVDDDDDIRYLTGVSLEATAGWEVVTAASGAEALSEALARTPDVVLLDLMMPEMDGLATVERMRAEPTLVDVPVILFTAKASVGDDAPWEGADISGVLGKPYDPMQLAGNVRGLLGWGPER